MSAFLTSFNALRDRAPEQMVLLYSGGVDGTFLLRQLRDLGTEVTALTVQIGDFESTEVARQHAEIYGSTFRTVDVTDEFFAEFVPAAVHADAVYQDLFPISSSLTRPLMARAAVRTARELGCGFVGHTATYVQNSAMRLTAAVAALAPDIVVAAPYLGSDVPRSVKLDALRADGAEFVEGIHSIDANPWARVIECGSLEDPENLLDETVFRWTCDPSAAPDTGAEVDIGFADGIPCSLDGAAASLREIVSQLNDLGGRHAVGRSSGLEDTAFGVKNHEIREAPAATVLIKAHQVLANAVLTQREHAVRATVAREWTTEAVAGRWFGTLGRALAASLIELDRPLCGTVRLRLVRGAVTVLRVTSAHGLYLARGGEQFHDLMRIYSFEPWLSLATWPERSRQTEIT